MKRIKPFVSLKHVVRAVIPAGQQARRMPIPTSLTQEAQCHRAAQGQRRRLKSSAEYASGGQVPDRVTINIIVQARPV